MNKLSHIDNNGKAKMVDVGDKTPQIREAIAEGFIKLNDETVDLIKANNMKKGDVLTVAEIAGIQGAKKTSELIPLCHNIFLSKISVETSIVDDGVKIIATAKSIGQTGVEMEALTAVNIALLTIYDMCKAVDKQMIMSNIKLISKTKKDI